jgi:uncharacterized protein
MVVADTSPVLSLARISRLDLLRVLYQQVLIPSAVYQELRASSSQPTGHIDFDAVPWLIVATAMDRRRVEALREDLDLGEAEAIVLAMERRADLLSHRRTARETDGPCLRAGHHWSSWRGGADQACRID